MIDGIRDLLADEGFRTGFSYGLLALVVAIGLTGLTTLVAVPVARVFPKLEVRGLWPWAGLGFAGAGLAAFDDFAPVDTRMHTCLALLVVGAGVVARLPVPVWIAGAALGAWLFADTAVVDMVDEPGWAFGVILGTTLVGGVLMADFDRAFARTGLPPVMLAVSLLGVYVTTPETQHSILLTGVALPLALLGWPWPLASLGVSGSFAVTAMVSWAVVLDGTFRPSSVVGGIASLGMFAVEPVVRRVLGWAETRQVLAVFGLHVVLVGACSRVAGLRSSTVEALVITAVVLVAAGVALAVIERRADDRPDAGPDGGAAPGGELAPVGDDARGTSAFPHIS